MCMALLSWLKGKVDGPVDLDGLFPDRRKSVDEFLHGRVVGQLWPNHGRKGVYFTATFRRVYGDSPKNATFAWNFHVGDLADLTSCLLDVMAWFEYHRAKIKGINLVPMQEKDATPLDLD